MSFKKIALGTLIGTFLFSFSIIAQSKWEENDDMYFSKKDREKIYSSTENSGFGVKTSEESLYPANYNSNNPTFRKATIQPNASTEADNNQYFIKDYSINNKAKTYSGINSNTGYKFGANMLFSLGSFYQSPYYNSYYNAYNDPFSPYYDPFYKYNMSNNCSTLYNNSIWGNNCGGFSNNYYGNSYSRSSSTRSKVRYEDGRKIIYGSRSKNTRSNLPVNFQNISVSDRDRPVKNQGSIIIKNKKSPSIKKYPNSVQNRNIIRSNTKARRENAYNRINNTNWNNNYNNTKNSSSSSSFNGSSSEISRSSGSKPSSKPSSRPSSGGSQSSGGRR